MERWGLIGTWSTDCSRPAGEAGRLSYVPAEGGKVMHERDFGSSRDSREILIVALVPGDRLELFIDFGGGGVRRWVMIKGGDGRIRAVENARIDGTDATVANGRFLDGAETPWQSRCNER